MNLSPSRWVDVGSCAALLALGSAMFFLGARHLRDARAEHERQRAEASDISSSTDVMGREIDELHAKLLSVEGESESLRGGAELRVATGDQTTWIVGVAEEIGLRLDRLTPATASGDGSEPRVSLVVQGVGDALGVADLLARLRAERPTLELRSLRLQAERREFESDPHQVNFETRIEWRETLAAVEQP